VIASQFKIFYPTLQKKLKHPTRKPTRQRQQNSTMTMVYWGGRQEPLAITSSLSKWRQKCYYETFVLNSTVVILLKFSAKNPPLHKSRPSGCEKANFS